MTLNNSHTLTDLGRGEQYIRYRCESGVAVTRYATPVEYPNAIANLAIRLDSSPGVLLASSYEYPGRYRRWDIGFVNPPLMFEGRGRSLSIKALNRRGLILLPEVERALSACDDILSIERRETTDETSHVAALVVDIRHCDGNFGINGDFRSEEMRSRRPTVFSALRAIIAHFKSEDDSFLGLFGAFGYDLTFQFEEVNIYQTRSLEDRDLVLYFPDEIVVADHRIETANSYRYEFTCRAAGSELFRETTGGFARSGPVEAYRPDRHVKPHSDHAAGEFAMKVELAKEYFQRGDLFEVVPGQVFREGCVDTPSQVFQRLQASNPAPYGALMNLRQREYLVAASPEMFVRVRGSRVETCPISGTIRRGNNAIEDAQQIKTLLNSTKDEAELSMCTDVDRNDKSRVCEPGTVEVIGRRQIEMYSRLIHTVDHVCGTLREDMDALDAFLAHTWAVTVTGAPKLAAMQFIENHEKSQRHWYGGAMGQLGFDGNINTGLTLRTLRVKDGVGEVRAGATLLSDSIPEEEEAETRLKASALLSALRGESFVSDKVVKNGGVNAESTARHPVRKCRALMVDHRDSFVHNLGSYFRECGLELMTLRPEDARSMLRKPEGIKPDLIILSPGPGSPSQFAVAETVAIAVELGIPVFGVCLGLQGIVEYFGGKLTQLSSPMHGKDSLINHSGSALFAEMANPFKAGRYHSLIAESVPACLRVTARSVDDGAVMAVEHESLPVSAVQFHPESILSLEGEAGRRLIKNALATLLS